MAVRPHKGLEIDGFILGEKLHEGGFATIWEVFHPNHAIAMLMKVPTILDGFDGPTIVGFEIEQMIMPRLSGQHVPHVVAIGDFDVMPYIVVERIAGDTLVPIFKSAPRPIAEAISLSERIAAAMHDIHRQHVVHLDVKPSNILQRPGGEMVFIDFGLSRHDQLPDLLAEEFTIPMGTYPYIAPEQVLGQRNDLRSDIFALGAMMYELVSGKLPFGEPARVKQLKKRFWQDPVPLRSLRPETPEWLQEVIMRALAVDPAHRYQSAAQLRFDLLHPDQVAVTERGKKTEKDTMMAVFKRWRKNKNIARLPEPVTMEAQMNKAPIIMAAVDLSPEMESLADRLLFAVQRMLVIQPDARIACVNVLKTARLGVDITVDADGNNLHVQRLVALKHWGRALDLPEERITYSVLEHSDPAEALIEFATNNHADHIMMGARGHSTTRRYLGSVSSQVVAEAPCSVTVIRIPEAGTVFAARHAAEQIIDPQDDPRTRESSQSAGP